MRRLLALLALVTSAILVLAQPAAAGGPTSVLVTDPSSGHATALYYSDAEYADLDRMLAEGEAIDEPPPVELGERALHLTWMIHDVMPWRTHRLYLDAEGGPVVATQGSELTGDANATTWTRPAEGRALLQVVDRVLARGSGRAPATASEPALTAPAPTPEAAALAAEQVTRTRWFSLAGWRWLVPGLVVGAAATGLLTRSRLREGTERRVLVDATG